MVVHDSGPFVDSLGQEDLKPRSLLGRMIPRGGAGLMRSVCVLAVLVVVDTGRLCKLVLPALARHTTLNTCGMNCRNVRTKSTVCL